MPASAFDLDADESIARSSRDQRVRRYPGAAGGELQSRPGRPRPFLRIGSSAINLGGQIRICDHNSLTNLTGWKMSIQIASFRWLRNGPCDRIGAWPRAQSGVNGPAEILIGRVRIEASALTGRLGCRVVGDVAASSSSGASAPLHDLRAPRPAAGWRRETLLSCARARRERSRAAVDAAAARGDRWLAAAERQLNVSECNLQLLFACAHSRPQRTHNLLPGHLSAFERLGHRSPRHNRAPRASRILNPRAPCSAPAEIHVVGPIAGNAA